MPNENYRYPYYDHQPAITSTVYQSGEEIEWGDKYAIVTRTCIGPDNDILDMGKSHKVGKTLMLGNSLSGTIKSCKTTKMDSDRSKITYSVQSKSMVGAGSSGGDDDPNILDETWQVNMAQMEVPLYRYCSPYLSDELEYGNAVALNAWENETDVEVKNSYSYRVDNGTDTPTITALSGRTLDLAKLMNAGVEARLVFYPQASRVTQCMDYNALTGYSDRLENLNYIDDTPQSQLDFGNVTYSWLKTAFDFTQNVDGTWTVTESWIGSPEYLGGWSNGLYNLTSHWNMYPTNYN